jgi:uncharacterized protein with GYD domain
MTTFVLLTKVSTERMREIKGLADMDEAFERKRIASYALLGAYDLMHIFEAPDAITAAKVALLANQFGPGTTQTLTAIPFSEFTQAIQELY